MVSRSPSDPDNSSPSGVKLHPWKRNFQRITPGPLTDPESSFPCGLTSCVFCSLAHRLQHPPQLLDSVSCRRADGRGESQLPQRAIDGAVDQRRARGGLRQVHHRRVDWAETVPDRAAAGGAAEGLAATQVGADVAASAAATARRFAAHWRDRARECDQRGEPCLDARTAFGILRDQRVGVSGAVPISRRNEGPRVTFHGLDVSSTRISLGYVTTFIISFSFFVLSCELILAVMNALAFFFFKSI